MELHQGELDRLVRREGFAEGRALLGVFHGFVNAVLGRANARGRLANTIFMDEVLRHVGTQAPVQRVLISDLTPAAVARALRAPRDNREFRRLSHSALARQRADWLYGINLTRFYTLSYQQQGEQGVYSVGRVQTPVLGLVVARDQTIENFQAKPYFRIEASFRATEEEDDPRPFTARWLPDEAFQDHVPRRGVAPRVPQ